MAEKGYVLVPEDQVAQKSAELSEIAARPKQSNTEETPWNSQN
jgi:hypothetical protein